MRNFKKRCKILLCFAILIGVVFAMDFALYPCTFMRNDIHTVTTSQVDTVILGTSNGKMGIDPEALLQGTGQTGHNLCVGGEYPVDAYYLAKLMIEKQNPKRIIFELDPGYFTTKKEVGNNYLLFYHEFPLSIAKAEYFADTMMGTDFRNMFFPFYEYPLSYETQHMKNTVYQKATNNYDVSYLKGSAQEYHENGFIERYAVDTSKLQDTEATLFEESKIQETNMQYMDKLIQLCKDKGIEFEAVIMPLPAVRLAKYPENFKNAWIYFGNYFEKKDVKCYNFNLEYYDAFTHDLAAYTDYEGHLYGEGAEAFSAIFGKILQGEEVSSAVEAPIKSYTDCMNVTGVYPHNDNSFTEGLFVYHNALYESTGEYNQSKLYKNINLETGMPELEYGLPENIFGEGSTVLNDKIYMLTYKENTAYGFDPNLNLEETYHYPHEGWGLTTDGNYLIASDGSSTLYYMDDNMQDVKQLPVNMNGTPVKDINELEYIGGNIWANINRTNYIVIIDPETGNVTSCIDLAGLLSKEFITDKTGAWNGIAYNQESNKLYITGKNFMVMYECEINNDLLSE